MADNLKRIMGRIFSAVFLIVSVALVVMSAMEFARTFAGAHGQELIGGIVRAINTAVIALATFELGLGIGKEYTVPEENHGLYPVVRRTVTRFVSVVCIALVLEGLIMVIKYSQLDLAGNLYYPVAIIVGSSVLLMGLGVFIHLTRADLELAEATEAAGGAARASAAGQGGRTAAPRASTCEAHRADRRLTALQRAVLRPGAASVVVRGSRETAGDRDGNG